MTRLSSLWQRIKDHPVIAAATTIAGAIVSTAIAAYWAAIEPFFLAVLGWLFGTTLSGLGLLATPVPLWVLLAACAATLTTGVLTTRRRRSSLHPAVAAYTSDEFYGIRWRWSWRQSPAGTEVTGLWSACPECDTQLVRAGGNHDAVRGYKATYFICETCSESATNRAFRADLHSLARLELRPDAVDKSVMRRITQRARELLSAPNI